MGLYTWDDTFKGGFAGFDPRGIDTHFSHYPDKVDHGEVKSVNDGV